MPTDPPSSPAPRHFRIAEPSPWVVRFAPLIGSGGHVLDLACGGGRHGRYLRAQGHHVTFVDRNVEPLADLENQPNLDVVELDLENGQPWPFAHRRFDAVVVTNYLHRPLLPHIVDIVAPGGVLIYETFAHGNARYSRPSNPDYLLRPGELLDIVRDRLMVVAFENGIKAETPLPGVVQRICAVNAAPPPGEHIPDPVPLTP